MGAAILERQARSRRPGPGRSSTRAPRPRPRGRRSGRRCGRPGRGCPRPRARSRRCARLPGSRGPGARTASASESAQRTARAGPSNVARNPSPAVPISRPAYRASCSRTRAWWARRTSAHAASVSSAARAVEPTMSVNRTVASTRSLSGRVRAPVRNCSISPTTASASADPGQMVVAGELHERRSGDAFGEVPARLDGDHPVARAVDDERRDADGAQDRPDIDLGVHPGQRDRGPRAGAHPDVARPVLPKAGVSQLARAPGCRGRPGRPNRARSPRGSPRAVRPSCPTGSPRLQAAGRTRRTG